MMDDLVEIISGVIAVKVREIDLPGREPAMSQHAGEKYDLDLLIQIEHDIHIR